MKIKIIATGEIEEVNDSYGARLVEQGRAVPVPAEKKAATKPKAKAAAPKNPTAKEPMEGQDAAGDARKE